MVELRATARVPLALATAKMVRILSSHELDGGAAAAVATAEPMLLRAGVTGVSKQVEIHVLEPSYYPGRAVIPMRWQATGRIGELFPTLDANLDLRRQTDAQSDLVLTGSYRPPFGRAGAGIDQLVLHQLAERTLGHFVRLLVTALETSDTAEPARDDPPLGQRAGIWSRASRNAPTPANYLDAVVRPTRSR